MIQEDSERKEEWRTRRRRRKAYGEALEDWQRRGLVEKKKKEGLWKGSGGLVEEKTGREEEEGRPMERL
ncbi:hypothetical protein FO519_000528 [Halicephalobus sp. NKZ332]|nr:hypothetical protein FO519_000528 [Halicephalobus sp. NKZ332]